MNCDGVATAPCVRVRLCDTRLLVELIFNGLAVPIEHFHLPQIEEWKLLLDVDNPGRIHGYFFF